MAENSSDGRSDNECPECGSTSTTSANPVIEDNYECSTCLIAFNSKGEVLASE
jgi:DNA-directed RNA polymerase subunit RPC12/RpoP